MILVSNHVKDKVKLDNDVVIRINVAWVQTLPALRAIVEDNATHSIYLDYPEGRSKPPRPTLSIHDAIRVAKEYENIKFFAISNAENCIDLEMLREVLPERVKMVPKIETPKGVLNIANIVKGADTDTVMFDKEDLYTALNADAKLYEQYMNSLRRSCAIKNIIILELQGVIFYESE